MQTSTNTHAAASSTSSISSNASTSSTSADIGGDAISDADLERVPAQLARLADLLSAARERRSTAEGLRASIARRFVFLRAATARISNQVSTQVESWLERRDRVRDEVTSMAHVLRVRADLTPEEQRSFDQLVVDYTDTTLGLLVDRDHATSLTAVQRYLASVATTMPPSP